MTKTMCGIRCVFTAISLTLLTACSSITHVQEITADKEGFLFKKFSPQSLLPSVAPKIPADEISGNFKRLTITVEVDTVFVDGKKVAYKAVHTLVNAGNGLVMKMQEASSNGIPYQILYSLTYRGIVPLRWQAVAINAPQSTSSAAEIKDVIRMDPIPVSLDKEFFTDYISGYDIQLINFSSEQSTCKSTNTIAASDIHQKLSGQANVIECINSVNNTVQHNSKWALLKDYGVAIMMENATTAQKAIYRVTDVEI